MTIHPLHERRSLDQSSARRDAAHFIDGMFTQGTTGKSWENFCPVDGSLIGRVPEGGRAEVDAAVAAAHSALYGDWGRLSVVERTDMLGAVADEINCRFDEFLEAECLDTGKPMDLASQIDIPRGAANFKMFTDVAKTVSTECFPMATPDGAGALNYALRRPRGVIAVISPWNLPLLLMTWKVGPALALGNTVVVKPSEETPLTATLLGEVMNKVGVPKGVYNVVHGLGPNSAGEFLTQHPRVNGVTFTGETRTGEAIMRQAAHGIRPVSFELGGKNPALIFADADLDKAIEGTMRSVFSNCGQVCLGTERVYVERPIFDEFVAHLKKIFGDISSKDRMRVSGSGRARNRFAGRLPGPGTIYMGQNLRFKAPVRAGDTVHATVTVKELMPEKCRASLSTVCTVNGEIVIDGDALVMTTSHAARNT
jgi:aminomuconate-semialdehyde/2-hydroxymuconate-6-semialdehyde dehydrogenase